ncbi:MAG: PVC-type heme-binding CxxCH protein, partial [Planctomycetaceae bacterium]
MATSSPSRPAAPRARAILLGSALALAAGAAAARGQGHPAGQAAARMTLPEGVEVALVAAEPDVRQTIFVKHDDRGRLWTIQYLQYPNPAGLERVEVDRWSRTTYDRVPEPPPHGPRGDDRITICEDRDGDGRADTFRDFLDGLNLVTGVEFGHGGVWVLNVPYLLFYPDRDRDDVPDGDPEVCLSGFGMEDAQSLSNHLTWGPDGWLYGVNGSTTTCAVRGIEFQSGVWRYHPLTREFELFCEGGYNCFGLTFDRTGELLVSTNGGPFLHAMQGAVYYKSFGKHGPLHHPHAHHHFPILRCDAVPGGPPTGGLVYRSDGLPAHLRDTFIAGNFLGHSVSWWRVLPRGSTFDAAYGGLLLDAHDTWFGPTDLAVGPGGTLAVSDFHDARTAHPDPDAAWDRRNGRIFALRAAGTPPAAPPDLAALPSDALVDLLTGPDGWAAERARVELAGRRDAAVAPRLEALARSTDDEDHALAGLWGLAATGRFDEALALDLFAHPAPAVRRWAVRLLGDRREISPAAASALLALARRETD